MPHEHRYRPRVLAPIDEDHDCFGCSATNPAGLALVYEQIGPAAVRTTWTPQAHHVGAPGVVHGGILATAIDETLGWTCHAVLGDSTRVVTAELSLQYRRPVVVGRPVEVRGEVERHDPPNLHLRAVVVGPDGEEAVRATARFRQIEALPAPGPVG